MQRDPAWQPGESAGEAWPGHGCAAPPEAYLAAKECIDASPQIGVALAQRAQLLIHVSPITLKRLHFELRACRGWSA